jgi:hypothetical protein
VWWDLLRKTMAQESCFADDNDDDWGRRRVSVNMKNVFK